MHLRSWILAMVAALASCGGGSPPEQPAAILVTGDSLTSSRNLQVTRVQRMQQELGDGYKVEDFSWPARGAAPSLYGLPTGQPYTTYADLVQAQQPRIACILFGGAEVVEQAVTGVGTPEQFESDMRKLIAIAQGAGSKVVLATIIDSPDFREVEAPYNAAIRRMAVDTNSELADINSLPPFPTSDGIHPAQAGSDAGTAMIVQAVRRIVL